MVGSRAGAGDAVAAMAFVLPEGMSDLVLRSILTGDLPDTY